MPLDLMTTPSNTELVALASLMTLEDHPALEVGMVERDDMVRVILVTVGSLMWSIEPGALLHSFEVRAHTPALTNTVFHSLRVSVCAEWLHGHLAALFPPVSVGA